LPAYQGGELAAAFDPSGACTVARARRRRGGDDRGESAYRKALRGPGRPGLSPVVAGCLVLGLYLLERLAVVVPSSQLKREASDRQQASSNIEESGRALKQQGEPTPPNPALNMSRWPYLGEVEELNTMRQEGRIPKSSHVPSDKGGERAR